MRLDGRRLRRVLVVWLMDARRPMSVGELAALLARAGLSVRGRPGKVISDALRWEVRRGRVLRLGRGRYQVGAVPRTTGWRIRKEADEVLGRGGAAAGGDLAGEALDRQIDRLSRQHLATRGFTG